MILITSDHLKSWNLDTEDLYSNLAFLAKPHTAQHNRKPQVLRCSMSLQVQTFRWLGWSGKPGDIKHDHFLTVLFRAILSNKKIGGVEVTSFFSRRYLYNVGEVYQMNQVILEGLWMIMYAYIMLYD